ncbi:hypothetical protein PL75_00970 [Neisseria arctica]|uniref:Uncharacterized protein n=1 Tax=Neisseria arctica TaxID=1470200 RepID=A0A0J1C6G9_9NEIS|nr:alpha/beta hydrolase [Neisseria arctica]KLT73938.1 hypothetical protein PL75_00970 [Neisseria arctica]UOO86864.1 alpha/beta hydrolase [Neisseria arctica]
MLNKLILNGREFLYYHFKAQQTSAPILIIFHGAGYNKIPAKFRDPNINVVAIMDTFGHEDIGSWFLGEEGDFFWINAIKQIITKLKYECNSEQVFCWGSSMGGYAAILHGYLNNVAAVYANVPQTKLLGSTYILHNKNMKSCLEYVLNGDESSKYNDLTRVIKTATDTVFIITFNQLEGLNYFSEQGFPFLRHLHGIRQKMYLEVRPNNQHAVIYNISESLELFKKYTDIHIKNTEKNNKDFIHLTEKKINTKGEFEEIINFIKQFELNSHVNLKTNICWSEWISLEGFGFNKLKLLIKLTTSGTHQIPALFTIDFDGIAPPDGFFKKSNNSEIGFFNYISGQDNDISVEKLYTYPIPLDCKRLRIGLRAWQDIGSVLNKLNLTLLKEYVA